MKFKRSIALLAALILCMGAASCKSNDNSENKETIENEESVTSTKSSEDPKEPDEPDEPDESSITPLLYKVTDADSDVVWLFGSVHIGSEDFYPLPDYVTDAFEGSDALAVEYDIVSSEKSGTAEETIFDLMYTDGTTIKDHISEETYQNGVKVLKKLGYYFSEMDSFLPVLWSSLIDEIIIEDTQYSYDLGIDRHLITTAHDEDKPVYDIESEEFQVNLMKNFSPEIQELLLQSSIDAYKEGGYEEQCEALVDAWCMGDEAELTDMLHEESEGMSARELELYKEYNYMMETSRNIAMTDYAESVLEKGGEEVFICVGAAHVIGEGGMAQLLEERGYTVEIMN